MDAAWADPNKSPKPGEFKKPLAAATLDEDAVAGDAVEPPKRSSMVDEEEKFAADAPLEKPDVFKPPAFQLCCGVSPESGAHKPSNKEFDGSVF